MKKFSCLSNISLLLLIVLPGGYGTNVDRALQYRQNVPKGTGSSASSAAQSSTASAALTVSSAPTVSDTSSPSPSSTNIDTQTPLTSSSAASDSTEENPTSTLLPVSTPPSQSSSSPEQPTTTSFGSNTPSQPSVPPTSSSVSVGKSSANREPSALTTPRATISKTQKVITTEVFISGSVTQTSVFTTSELQAVSNPASSATSPPTLDASSSGSNSSVLKQSQKRVIVGVIVGIGGAILLGGIAVVVWRIWGKRKHTAEEDHELMDSQPGSSGLEKRSSVSGNSPFRSTLDQYHNPAGPVNTASNF